MIWLSTEDKNQLSYASMKRQVCFSIISHKMIITIGAMIMKITTNTCKSQKFSRKNARRKCRSHFKHNSFSDKLIYGPLDFFYQPMGNINFGITR